MPTNRELDALIAEHVMGSSICRCDPQRPTPRFNPDTGLCETCGNGPIQAYSTSPFASKQIRDKMREEGWTYEIAWRGDYCCAKFNHSTYDEGHADADTEERAVALATLKTKGVPVDADPSAH